MADENNFYVLVPSDSSMNLYSDNHGGNFKMQLGADKLLEGRWEVALSEIQFAHTWYNMPVDTSVIVFSQRKRKGVLLTEGVIDYIKDDFTKPENVDEIKFSLPKGTYRSADSITLKLKSYALQEIGRRNREAGTDPYDRISYTSRWDAIQRKCSIPDITHNLIFSDDAGGHFKALGLPTSKYESNLSKTDPMYPALEEKFSSLHFYPTPRITEKIVSLVDIPVIFVYCNFITPQLVGDSQVRLLRTVPVTGAFSEGIHSTFDRPYYLPVETTTLRVIHFELRNSEGRMLDFQGTRVNCYLHFRKMGSNT